jgi:hypothetical protein
MIRSWSLATFLLQQNIVSFVLPQARITVISAGCKIEESEAAIVLSVYKGKLEALQVHTQQQTSLSPLPILNFFFQYTSADINPSAKMKLTQSLIVAAATLNLAVGAPIKESQSRDSLRRRGSRCK